MTLSTLNHIGYNINPVAAINMKNGAADNKLWKLWITLSMSNGFTFAVTILKKNPPSVIELIIMKIHNTPPPTRPVKATARFQSLYNR